MSIKESLNNKLDGLYSALRIVLIEPFSNAKKNFTKLYQQDKQKAVVLLVGFILLMILISFLSFKFLWNNETFSNQYPQKFHTYTGQAETSAQQRTVVSQFLETYKTSVSYFTPIFDSFISQTADVTGKSTPSGNGYSFNIWGNNQAEFVTGQKIQPASVYSNKLLSIVVPVLVLLIVIEGFNIIQNSSDNSGKLKDFFFRIGKTTILLIMTPIILSLSIMFMNLLSKQLTGGQTLTEFMTTFIDTLEKANQAGTADKIWTFVTNAGTMGSTTTIAMFESLPIIIPLLLILLLYLYVSFQFILRFLNLYFLACVYPFAIVFSVNEKTAGITSSYWKQWTTYLIHQPVFVLGYVIVQNLLLDMLKNNGAGFEQILMFLGLLLFLSSINMVSARIWGDVYSAVSTNIQSAIGAGIAKSVVIDRPRQVQQDFTRGAIGGGITGISSFAGRKAGEKLGLVNGRNGTLTSKSNLTKGGSLSKGSGKDGEGLLVQHSTLKNPLGSQYAQDLTKSGFQVNSADPANGILGVSGDFYSTKESDTGLATLYKSQEDAIKDGVRKEDISPVSVDGLKIRDLSNNVGKQIYNQDIGKYAKDKGFKGEIHLTPSSDDKRVATNMKFAKGYNQTRGVDGVVVNRFAKNAPQDDPNGRITKIRVYSDLLNQEEDK